MTEETRFLDFGHFRLDRRERLLYAAGEPVQLPPKAVDLLLALTDEPGALRSKEELMAKVWPDVVVDEANLTQNIFLLRKALDDDGSKFIVTVPRRGYRFVGDATARPSRETAAAAWPPHSISIGIVIVLLAAGAWLMRAHAHTSRSTPIRTIAVLPFRAVNGNRDDRILQLGMADTLIIKLSQLSGVIVTPSHAVTPYLDSRADPLEAGRNLGVNAIIEGSLQRAGHRIRCSVRLLRVDDGSALWADQFDEDDAGVFDLEDGIASRVVSALDLRLTPQERTDLAKRYTNNRQAYELYLRGRLSWQTFEKDGLEASIRYYNAALQADPNYALAYAGIAKSYSVMTIYGLIDDTEGWNRSRDAAVHAVELDPQLSEPHTPLAAVAIFHDWNWRRAEEEAQRAIDLDPASDAHTLKGYVLLALGRPDDALPELKRVHELDPFWIVAQNDYVIALYCARRYDDAIREGLHVLETQPHNNIVRYVVGKALKMRGRLDEAAQQQQLNIEQAPDYTRSIAELGAIAMLRGDRKAAEGRIAEIEKWRPSDHYRRTDIMLAQLYTAMGDRDAAFRALDASVRIHSPFLWQIVSDPSFDALRSDPRYPQLLAKMNLGR